MSSRACAALIADMAFGPDRAPTHHKPVRKADKPKRRTRRFKRSQID
jgi:hypothetical protein